MQLTRTIATCLILACMFTHCQSSRQHNPAEKIPASLSDSTWTLVYISGPRISFEGLYPGQKPTLKLNAVTNTGTGTTGCNSYSGVIRIHADSFYLTEPIVVTEMYCETGMQGETTFLKTMQQINRYAVQGDSLTLLMDAVPMLRFAH